LKHIKTLRTKKGRKETGAFLGEGVRVLEEAIRLRFLPRTVYAAEALLADRGRALLSQFRHHRVTVKMISAKQLERISDTRTPQGIVAVFDTPRPTLDKLSRASLRKVLLCEDINDPGNLGTLLRSALAFAFDPVILVGQAVEPYSPKVVRASAGALFGLTIVTATIPDAIQWAKTQEVPLIAADSRGDSDREALAALVEQGRFGLVLGAEAEGVSPELIQASALVHRVAHEPRVESLNVAIAGSILMKQVYDYS